jgi:hypothetical protein
LPLCPLRAGAVGGAEKGARARVDAGGAAGSRLRKRKGRGREGPGGVGAGTEAAAGVGRKMKKRKVEAEEVLRPFILLKGRREGPFGAGGVLDEGGKGGEVGSNKDGEVAEVGREGWYLNGFPENREAGGQVSGGGREAEVEECEIGNRLSAVLRIGVNKIEQRAEWDTNLPRNAFGEI